MDVDAMTLIERPWSGPAVMTAAFERLFRAEYERVVRVAYRVVGDQGEAEDVAQEVFLAFYRAHPADSAYAAPWLHRAAAHTALNALLALRYSGLSYSEVAAATGTNIDQIGTRLRRAHDAFRKEVSRRIPGPAAELLALRYSGLSYSEVAAATGTNIDQIGTRLRRAHDAFRKEVSRERQR
jgi:RNA polymerase sigma-70 factor (ECF subfamily)